MKNMKGKQLFEKYTSRDFPIESKEREYAQELQTIFNNIGEAIYPLLELAEKDGKKLAINENELPELWDFLEAKDVVLV